MTESNKKMLLEGFGYKGLKKYAERCDKSNNLKTFLGGTILEYLLGESSRWEGAEEEKETRYIPHLIHVKDYYLWLKTFNKKIPSIISLYQFRFDLKLDNVLGLDAILGIITHYHSNLKRKDDNSRNTVYLADLNSNDLMFLRMRFIDKIVINGAFDLTEKEVDEINSYVVAFNQAKSSRFNPDKRRAKMLVAGYSKLKERGYEKEGLELLKDSNITIDDVLRKLERFGISKKDLEV